MGWLGKTQSNFDIDSRKKEKEKERRGKQWRKSKIVMVFDLHPFNFYTAYIFIHSVAFIHSFMLFDPCEVGDTGLLFAATEGEDGAWPALKDCIIL